VYLQSRTYIITKKTNKFELPRKQLVAHILQKAIPSAPNTQLSHKQQKQTNTITQCPKYPQLLSRTALLAIKKFNENEKEMIKSHNQEMGIAYNLHA
jgi:hypothetical protein